MKCAGLWTFGLSRVGRGKWLDGWYEIGGKVCEVGEVFGGEEEPDDRGEVDGKEW